MEYSEILNIIHSKRIFGKKLGFQRIGTLLSGLGNPQDKLKIIHIAGTNGKGSTTSMCCKILEDAGYKVGKYISPYLVDFCERISINGENISQKRLEELVLRVLEIDKELEEPTNEFEFITCIAYLYFYEENVDVAVIEVGLGGRFDSTNIIKNPLISVIASISLDHTNILGDTIKEIAFEKCGIIKPKVPVVCYGKQNKEALEVIKDCCKEKESPLIIPDCDVDIIKQDIEGTIFKYKNFEVEVKMLLEHQIYNSLSAFETMLYLRENNNFKISDENILNGIKNTMFPGRFQVFSKDPYIIVDGSHNVEGVETLKQGIEKYFDNKKIITLVSMVKDKNYVEALKKISEISDYSVVTEIKDNPRGETAEILSQNISCEHTIEKNNEKALDICLDLLKKDKDSVLIICGSLYLAGDMIKILRQIKTLNNK